MASLNRGDHRGPSLGLGSPWIVALAYSRRFARDARALELRRVDGLIEPRFFASRPFAAATVIAVATFTALGGARRGDDRVVQPIAVAWLARAGFAAGWSSAASGWARAA